jgi:hypothetical protein
LKYIVSQAEQKSAGYRVSIGAAQVTLGESKILDSGEFTI